MKTVKDFFSKWKKTSFYVQCIHVNERNSLRGSLHEVFISGMFHLQSHGNTNLMHSGKVDLWTLYLFVFIFYNILTGCACN